MHDMDDSVISYLRRRLVRLLIQMSALQPTLQRRMNKKKWSEGIQLHTLSGEEWLRLVLEMQMDALVGWCARCRVGECYREQCQQCGGVLLKLDEPFWSQIDRKIRRAMRKDRALLSRVKSDWESLYGTQHKPRFPLRLEWLSSVWEQIPRPPHHAFDPKVHYLVANWITSLRRLGLANEEIIDVLSKTDVASNPIGQKRNDHGKIPDDDLRKLGEEFRRAVGYVPGSVVDLSEMWRTMTWVARQRTVPMARLGGERVRTRTSGQD